MPASSYERALREAGFTAIAWHPLQLDPAAEGADYYAAYLRNPPVLGLTAVLSGAQAGSSHEHAAEYAAVARRCEDERLSLSLLERFAAHRQLRPDAPAIVCGEQRLSYAGLDAAANRLAHRLQALGVTRDVPVGICLEPGTQLLVAMLARAEGRWCLVAAGSGLAA